MQQTSNHSGWILGLGGSKHDFAACLLKDGQIRVAIEEERVSRLKRGYGVNLAAIKSIKYCLDYCGISEDDVLAVYVNDLLEPETYESLDIPTFVVGHHYSHAASCFFASPFAEAAILIADHSGGRFVRDDHVIAETFSSYYASGNNIDVLSRIVGEDESGPIAAPLTSDLRGSAGIDTLKRPRNSIGRFYARIAKKCSCLTMMGDGILHTESGKLMALAAYGDDRYYRQLRSYVELSENGAIRISMDQSPEGVEAFCERVLAKGAKGGPQELFHTQACLAWSTQHILEEVVVHVATYLQRFTNSRNICLAGGICLNGLANHRILERTPFENIFVQPAAHDAGTAIGAAYLGWHAFNNHTPHTAFWTPYLGRPYTTAEVLRAMDERSIKRWSPRSMTKTLASAIANDLIVGVYQGRSEFGPRALGNRSILGNCLNPDTKTRLDQTIKFRESYRPYAPAVRAEDSHRYFDLQADSAYMLLIGYIRPEWQKRLAAVTHVDGTARVQTVFAHSNPMLHELLTALDELTGIGVVLNTSMNVKGEPIIETPAEAIDFLLQTNIDALAIDGYICTRSEEELTKVMACAA